MLMCIGRRNILVEQKNYPLYQMLSFYWKKKIWFIIIPVICALLGMLIATVWPKDEKYVGKSVIFTSSTRLHSLTNPNQILSKYGKHFTGDVDIFVPSSSYVQANIKNDDKEVIEKELKIYNNALITDLLTQYEKQLNITKENIDILVTQNADLNSTIKKAQELFPKEQNEMKMEYFSTIILTSELQLSNNIAKIQSKNNDLAFFEEPFLVSNEIEETPSFTIQWTVAGFILGIFLSFFIITLWQYICRARKDVQHD